MASDDKCPIWNTDAKCEIDESRANGTGMFYCESPRAGGNYSISGLIHTYLTNIKIAEKIKLTS